MSTLLRVPALWAGAMAHLQIDEGAWSRAIAALTWLLLSEASLLVGPYGSIEEAQPKWLLLCALFIPP